MALKPEDLIGAWTFVTWTITRDDGQVTHPFQPDPGGMILYTPDGAMSATIHAGNRPRFSSDDIRKQSDAAKAAAFDTYFHYSGTWEIRGDDVVHHLTAALNPNLIGTEQVRHTAFDGDLLTLSVAEPLGGGRSRHHSLTWRKLKPSK